MISFVLAEKGVLRTDPVLNTMTPVAWALEARAIRARREDDREFALTLAKTLVTQFRRSMVEILGCNLQPAPGAPKDALPEENYTPLALLIGNPQMWMTTKKAWEKEAAAQAALANKANDSLIAELDKFGDMEPMLDDILGQEESKEAFALDPLSGKLHRIRKPGEVTDAPEELEAAGVEISDEPFREF